MDELDSISPNTAYDSLFIGSKEYKKVYIMSIMYNDTADYVAFIAVPLKRKKQFIKGKQYSFIKQRITIIEVPCKYIVLKENKLYVEA